MLILVWPLRNRPDHGLIVTGTSINLLGLAAIILSALSIRRSRQAPRTMRRISWALTIAFVAQTVASAAVGSVVQGGGDLGPVVVATTIHLLSAASSWRRSSCFRARAARGANGGRWRWI